MGGFILRNSWADGISFSHGSKAKGSHTAAFYAHMIGEADEDNYCPNEMCEICEKKEGSRIPAMVVSPLALLARPCGGHGRGGGGYALPGLPQTASWAD